MSRLKALLGHFRIKVTLVLLASLFFVMALSDLLVYKFTLDSQFNLLRERLMVVAQTAALMVDGDLLLGVPLNKEGVNTQQYNIIVDQLKKIKQVNPSLKYVYTMARTKDEGVWQFIVDPEPETKDKKITSYPGDKYNVTRCPEIFNALQRPSADKKFTIDEWGVFLSGYAPIRDHLGNPVAVLGVDMTAGDVYQMQKSVHKRALFVLFLGIFVSVVLGILISNTITNRIERLVEGTRHIAADDLAYKVDVKGHDEISELAESFNNMASSLYESKAKLREYFFRAMQSLVRILEAKDHYTRGHSGRVADYAQAIALKMGFSQEKSETVRKAAELHDIGKLVIHENILNKEGKLTDEEWEIIKEHPITGEDVLRPILLEEEMLSMVRSHHEHYDGNGYPDGIKGDNINIFAQIISVADAYDAMTSQRAYRQPLGKEKAIQELKANSGSQFNTKVVEAFLEALA